jgi:hypothetical protein
VMEVEVEERAMGEEDAISPEAKRVV